MLSHREDMRALGLAVPACDAGKPVRDVLDLDVERRGVEQIEPSARQHALPGARRRGASGAFGSHQASFANAAWRWQLTTWSLTMPTACMKAYTMVGPQNLNPRRVNSFDICRETAVSAGTWEV